MFNKLGFHITVLFSYNFRENWRSDSNTSLKRVSNICMHFLNPPSDLDALW